MIMINESQRGVAQRNSDKPLLEYSILTVIFASLFLSLCALRARKSRSTRFNIWDGLLLGVATHKAARIVSRDKVTSGFRAPFVRYEGSAGAGEVEEESVGTGMQKAIGDLVTCPYCLAPWIATALSFCYELAPRSVRTLCEVLGIVSLADFLNQRYAAELEANR